MCKAVLELKKTDFFAPGSNVHIHISKDDTKYDGVMHKHQFIEIVYVISGEAMHHLSNKKYLVQKGDIIIVNYNVAHAFFENNTASEKFVTYDLLFTPDFFDISTINSNDFNTLASSFLFYSLFPNDSSVNNSFNLIKPANSVIFSEIFDKIFFEYNTKEKGYLNIIRAHLIELITRIFRIIDAYPQTHVSGKQQELIEMTIDYLKRNYNEHINLDNIIANIFLSKNYFRQLFKSTTGLSITNFIQKIRVEKACLLLTTTEETASNIAIECGFNDAKFFYSTFKKLTGKTPSEYRKSCKQGK